MEQEMELILSKATVKGDFVDQWMLTYVPALVKYAENSKKKSLCVLMKELVYNKEG